MKKWAIAWLITIGVMLLISVVLAVLTQDIPRSFLAVFGLVYMLFVPGYIFTFAFFDEEDLIERITMSVALSIAFVPLVVILCNKYLRIPFGQITIFLEVLALVLIGLAGVYWKKHARKKKDVSKKRSRK
jgi:uncharacterized membrane protein